MPALAAAWFSMSWMRVLIFGKRQKQKNLSMLRLRQTMIELGNAPPARLYLLLFRNALCRPPATISRPLPRRAARAR